MTKQKLQKLIDKLERDQSMALHMAKDNEATYRFLTEYHLRFVFGHVNAELLMRDKISYTRTLYCSGLTEIFQEWCKEHNVFSVNNFESYYAITLYYYFRWVFITRKLQATPGYYV